MIKERLFIIHGMGPDAVGLVGKITKEISRHKGNIIDLHQDVLHGLFIIYAVIDLSESPLRIEEFNQIISRLKEDTGINLQVSTYNPIPRNAEKKNMLCVLVGTDNVGIIASVSQLLSTYGINIEFSRNIAREGVFLMELMTDISNATIPIDNLQSTVGAAMAQMGIKTLYQTTNVFNKKKRVIVFDLSVNLMDVHQRTEIAKQAGLDLGDLDTLMGDDTGASIARRLEGVSLATYEAIIAEVNATSDTVELIQTLKTMGYKIGLITGASYLFSDTFSKKLGIDYCTGIPYVVDDDSHQFTGALDGSFSGVNRKAFISSIIITEKIDKSDITIIDSGADRMLAGIHPLFNMGTVLGLYNRHSVSKQQLSAILASFGTQEQQA